MTLGTAFDQLPKTERAIGGKYMPPGVRVEPQGKAEAGGNQYAVMFNGRVLGLVVYRRGRKHSCVLPHAGFVDHK
jgi:hypothetical protein